VLAEVQGCVVWVVARGAGTAGSSFLLKEPPREGAVAGVYSAQQHVHYAVVA